MGDGVYVYRAVAEVIRDYCLIINHRQNTELVLHVRPERSPLPTKGIDVLVQRCEFISRGNLVEP